MSVNTVLCVILWGWLIERPFKLDRVSLSTPVLKRTSMGDEQGTLEALCENGVVLKLLVT